MRTDSGKLKTKSNVDPEIRFQKRERGQVIDVVGPVSTLKYILKCLQYFKNDECSQLLCDILSL